MSQPSVPSPALHPPRYRSDYTRGTCIMPKTPFALLVLALAAPSMPALGAEYCHGWREPGSEGGGWARHRGFRCPERWDGEGARYCCGACTLRYCCASASARLDQSACPADTDYSGGSAQEILPNLPSYLPFVIVVGAFLSFVLLGALISVCCCQCVKPKPTSEGPSPPHNGLLQSAGPSPKSSSSGIIQPRPVPTDLSMYNAFTPAFVPTIHHGAPPFYPNYSLPPEHTMLIAPAFLDTHAQPFPQDSAYSTVTV